MQQYQGLRHFDIVEQLAVRNLKEPYLLAYLVVDRAELVADKAAPAVDMAAPAADMAAPAVDMIEPAADMLALVADTLDLVELELPARLARLSAWKAFPYILFALGQILKVADIPQEPEHQPALAMALLEQVEQVEQVEQAELPAHEVVLLHSLYYLFLRT